MYGRTGLQDETIRSDLRVLYGKEFVPQSEEWHAFRHILETCGLDASRVWMMSLNQSECPASLALYASAVDDNRIDALALGEGMLVVGVYRDAGLNPWLKS